MLPTSSLKRHNHKVHTCEASRKQELLKHLIDLHAGKNILVLSKANSSTTQIPDKNLTLSNDEQLSKLEKERWDILISYDLPESATQYLERLSFATESALILLSEQEEALLYPIETSLGKNISREVIEGFEIQKTSITQKAKHRPTRSQKRSEDEVKANKLAKQARFKDDSSKEKPKKNDFSSNDYRKKKSNKETSNSAKRTPRVIKIPSESNAKKA